MVLDLLRSAAGRGQSAQALIRAGAVFGFTENTMRVTLSRLVSRGLVLSPERGSYRLAPTTDPLNDFVERWRLGESRVRSWAAGAWLLAHVEGADARSAWALEALGFRAVRAGLWTRPDNLALDLAALRKLAEGIGLDAGVLLVEGVPELPGRADVWLPQWRPRALDAGYRDGVAKLERSAVRLPGLSREAAMLESFTLGGQMVHRLAKDPLLPASMVDVAARERLWAAMRDYDARGREVWSANGAAPPAVTPRPQLLQVS